MAIYLADRTPTSSLQGHKTPYEVWHKKIPDLSHLRVFGCPVWVLDYKPKGKMDPRGWKGTFVGYGNGKSQYRVWNGQTVLAKIVRILYSLQSRIVYGGNTFVLTGWTDSDWAGDLDDSRSTAGYVFLLAGGAVSWASRKQPSVALSTSEAEYMAQKNAATEGIWLRGLLEELALRDNTLTTIRADNQGAIELTKNPEYHRRTKHISIQYHYTRECVENGEIELVYVPTEEMIADGLTKALLKARFDQFVNLLGLQASGP